MQKRLLSLILVVIILVTGLPVEAICEAESQLILSAAEQSAIRNLTGTQEGAAEWHVGMEPAPGMSANQLLSWVQWFLGNQYQSMQENYRQITVHAEKWLDDLAASDPQMYEHLLPFYYGAEENKVNPTTWELGLSALARRMQTIHSLKAELLHAESSLMTECEDIVSAYTILSQGDMTSVEQIIWSQRMLKDRDNLNAAMAEVLSNWESWEEECNYLTRWIKMGMPDFLDPVSADAKKLNASDENAGVGTVVLSASMVRAPQDEHSLLARLSPIRSAVADETGSTLTVVNGDQYLVNVKDEAGLPVQGAKVTVDDLYNPEAKRTQDTDQNGNAIFDLFQFSMINDGYKENTYDFDLSITADGYQTQKLQGLNLSRGAKTGIHLNKETSSPYFSSISFNGQDVLRNQEKYYSIAGSQSSKSFDVEFVCPGVTDCTVSIEYTDNKDEKKTRSSKVHLTDHVGHATFEDTWLGILKPDAPISFTITTTGGKETIKSNLVILPPVFNTESVLSDLSKYVGSKSVGFSFTVPKSFAVIGGSVVSLNIPFAAKWRPKFMVNPDGSVIIAFGFDMGDPLVKKENANQKELNAITKDWEQKGNKALREGDLHAQEAAMSQHGASMFGTFSFSAAVVATLKFDKANKQFKGTVDGSVMAMLKGSLTWYPVPGIYLAMNGELGAGVGMSLGFVMDYVPGKGIDSVSNFRYDSDQSLNRRIMFMLSITVSAGVGFKGVAGISISGSYCLNITIHLTRPGIRVVGSGGIYLLIELLLLSWKIDVFPFPTLVFVDTLEQPTAFTLPSLLIASAKADEPDGVDSNIPLSNISASMQAKPYTLVQSVEASNSAIQIVSVTDQSDKSKTDTLAFYIASDGELCLTDLTHNKTDNVNRAFTVYEGHESTSGMSWEKITEFTNAIVYDFRVVSVGYAAFIGILAADKMKTVTVTLSDGTQQQKTIPDTANGKVYTGLIQLEDFGGTIDLQAPTGGLGQGGQIFGYRELTGAEPWYISGMSINERKDVRTTAVMTIQCEDGQVNPILVRDSGSFELTEAPPTAGNIRTMVVTGYTGENSTAMNWYALEMPSGSDPATDKVQLVAYNNAQPMYIATVIDEGRISTFCLVSGNAQPGNTTAYDQHFDQYDYLAYIKEGDSKDGKTKSWRLMGAKMHHDATKSGLMTLQDIERIDYGVELTTANFQCQTINGISYLYWLETTSDNGHRLRALTWNPEEGVATAPYTLAEFPATAGVTPSSVILTENGEAYYAACKPGKAGSTILDICRFELQMVKSISISGAMLSDNLATPGQQLKMRYVIQNTGNVPVTGVTVAVVRSGPGDPTEGREIQKITYNFSSPDASTNKTVYSSRAISEYWYEIATGKTAVDRIHASLDSANENQWVRKRTTWKPVTDGSGQAPVTTETTDLVETDLLMPGSFAMLESFVLVKNDWNGTYSISLKLDSVQATKEFLTSADSAASNTPLARFARAMPDDIIDGSDYTAASLIDTALDDLTLKANYQNVHGKSKLALTIVNHAATDYHSGHQSLHLIAATDTGKGIIDCKLPDFNGDKVHSAQTYNLDFELDELMDVTKAKYLDVFITGSDSDADYQEYGNADNYARVYLNTADQLMILQQPRDMTVEQGANTSFSVSVTGGEEPYTYQWEYSADNGRTWTELPGQTASFIQLHSVTADMNGQMYRCVITDLNLSRIITNAVKLNVAMSVPATGDTVNPSLLVCTLLLSLGMLVILLRKRRKGNM